MVLLAYPLLFPISYNHTCSLSETLHLCNTSLPPILSLSLVQHKEIEFLHNIHKMEPVIQVIFSFLLSCPRFDFSSRCFSIPHILSITIISISIFSASGSHQLMFIAYYLVLSFLLMYSSSGLSTDVFS